MERDISAIRREAEAEELRADLNKLKVGVLRKKRGFIRTKGFFKEKKISQAACLPHLSKVLEPCKVVQKHTLFSELA